jgi:hypothetical protein
MASVNIYVSDDMKSAMDADPSVNWSSIAQGAFAAKLGRQPGGATKVAVDKIDELKRKQHRELALKCAVELFAHGGYAVLGNSWTEQVVDVARDFEAYLNEPLNMLNRTDEETSEVENRRDPE